MKQAFSLILFLLFNCSAMSMAADKSVVVIISGNLDYYQEVHKAFVIRLAKEGFDYQKVNMIMQMPSPDP